MFDERQRKAWVSETGSVSGQTLTFPGASLPFTSSGHKHRLSLKLKASIFPQPRPQPSPIPWSPSCIRPVPRLLTESEGNKGTK